VHPGARHSRRGSPGGGFAGFWEAAQGMPEDEGGLVLRRAPSTAANASAARHREQDTHTGQGTTGKGTGHESQVTSHMARRT